MAHGAAAVNNVQSRPATLAAGQPPPPVQQADPDACAAPNAATAAAAAADGGRGRRNDGAKADSQLDDAELVQVETDPGQQPADLKTDSQGHELLHELGKTDWRSLEHNPAAIEL